MSNNTALLVIDMQVGLLHDDQEHQDIYKCNEVLGNINTLLDKARATGTPIIYIQHDGHGNHPLKVGTGGWHIHPDIAPQDHEPVVRKEASDSFHNTNLSQELAERGIERLVITGAQTEYCMDTTARRATIMGYDVTVVSDAHTTWDRDLYPAAQAIAYYNEVLDGFGDNEHEIIVKPTDEITF